MKNCPLLSRLASENQKNKTELADVFSKYSHAYRAKRKLPLQHHKVIRAVSQCRTAALGGHIQECNHCGVSTPKYNSCRNRHCPKCQTIAKVKWLNARETELLPVEYFHVVFTLPHELNELSQFNDRIIYKTLFQSAWHAISTLGKDQKKLGGEMGMLSILHTWGQNLSKHIHIHCVVPGGAWQKKSESWKSAKKGFLFHVRALSRLFRGKYVSLLRELFDKASLQFNPKSASLNSKKQVSSFLNTLMKKDWVVYSKKPFDGAKSVLNYLGRYTHRIAISNDRILGCEDGTVKFRWRDYAHDNKLKTMTLDSHEFIRRFLSHTLPKGFTRIRSFGFLANACKKNKIKKIRNAIDDSLITPVEPSSTVETDMTIIQMMKKLTGVDISLCAQCKKDKMSPVYDVCQNNRAPP